MDQLDQSYKYLVTVYVTNHNYGKFIKQAVDSVLNQTFQDFELIIIDDGSTDNSREVIEQYADREKIKIIYQKNKGLIYTNNIALRASQGKYIVRLDADDFLDSSALLVLSNALEKNEEAGLAFPNYYEIDEKGEILRLIQRLDFTKDVELLDLPAHGACTMIRTKCLREIGGYDDQFTRQDGYDLWLKFIRKYKVINVETPLFYYRQHGSNLTKDETKLLETREQIKEKYKQREALKANALCVIPIRGPRYNSNSIAFLELNGITVMEYKINEVLKASNISKIVVSSPDESVLDFLKSKYNDTDIFFHKRTPQMARLNTGLIDTVDDILRCDEIKEIDFNILLTASIRFPFVKYSTIDDMVNNIVIFGADSSISVRAENDLIYTHNGKGLTPIINANKFSKLERELLYRYTGGLIAVNKEFYKKNKIFVDGKVGHVAIDFNSSFQIKTYADLKLANYISTL